MESALARSSDASFFPPAAAAPPDYFNATVHFQANGISFQTTPGQHMGRSGYKAPGFRSVCRIDQPEGCRTFTLFGRRVHGAPHVL